eukprot:359240-Chlamydomonas_euryale.AAC.17
MAADLSGMLDDSTVRVTADGNHSVGSGGWQQGCGNGGWQQGCGEWRVAAGVWGVQGGSRGVGNGGWQQGCGECRVAAGVWGVEGGSRSAGKGGRADLCTHLGVAELLLLERHQVRQVVEVSEAGAAQAHLLAGQHDRLGPEHAQLLHNKGTHV